MVRKMTEKDLLTEFVNQEKVNSFMGSGDDGFYAQQISDYVEKQKPFWLGFTKFMLVKQEEALQKQAEKILEDIENNFDTNHICNCEKWCNHWEKFKEKWEMKND